MWWNFHSHSRYCDGKGQLSDYLGAAKGRGILSLGFSSHAPLPFDSKWSMRAEDLDQYLFEIDSLRANENEIQIYKGLEVDFIPGVVSTKNFADALDYTIGSIHFVEQFDDGRRWEIDNTHAVFEEGLHEIFHGNAKDAFVRYFELTREMIRTSPPDIIGHLDKMKIQNIANKYFDESDKWYKEQIAKTLDLISESGIIVEVNTRGIYQKKSSTHYPGPWILNSIHRRNISITISSDAHHPSDLINLFPETAKLLHEIGFRKITVLRENEWKQLPFTEYGIAGK